MSGETGKVEGKWDQTKGRTKQAWGDLTDDEKTRSEGEWDETKGKGKEAKEHLKDAADDVKKAFKRDNR